VEFIGDATTYGTLVSFGEYPGLIDGEGAVRGELYDLANSASVLAAIDAAEEFDPGNVYNQIAENSQSLTEGSWRDR
jgi:gamma-glutamylcyclotransferase (GGCT)/AIG2-like uncharacterized protein YtfP